MEFTLPALGCGCTLLCEAHLTKMWGFIYKFTWPKKASGLPGKLQYIGQARGSNFRNTFSDAQNFLFYFIFLKYLICKEVEHRKAQNHLHHMIQTTQDSLSFLVMHTMIAMSIPLNFLIWTMRLEAWKHT